jgi:ATP-dependent DNA ligase
MSVAASASVACFDITPAPLEYFGYTLTEAKMEECRWLRPLLVGQFEFVEWTEDAYLRHSRFIALRDDKAAKDVTRQ